MCETIGAAGEDGVAAVPEWAGEAREVTAFGVDAAFDVPEYVPGWLQRKGKLGNLMVPGPALPRRATSVLAADVGAHMDEVAGQYGRVLAAAAPVAERDPEIRRWQCFEVDVLVTLPGEWPLRVEMFGGAALGAQLWLAELGDAERPPDWLYDDLDQGWALRVVTTPDTVYTLEWDWEKNGPDASRRALKFDRLRMAQEAIWAEARLRAVHAELVKRLGEDLWNREASRGGEGSSRS